MIYGLYRALTQVGRPLVQQYLESRLATGKESPDRLQERLGYPGRPRPEGRLAWLHGASVGESLSLLPLIEQLQRRGFTPMITTGTVTSARLMAERLPEGAFHQFIPVDIPYAVQRFLDHWRPDLVIWAESDFWPNLLDALRQRALPVVLVQGRVSPRSFARWRWAPGLIRRMLSTFSLCLGQTPEDEQRLRSLGAKNVGCCGNLKTAALPLPADAAALEALCVVLGDRKVWLAASTHPGEEILIGRVHQKLQAVFPDLLTVIVPRHPHRGPQIVKDLAEIGETGTLRSEGIAPNAAVGLYIADTLGELGLWYRLAPVALMGKSLGPGPGGGQNPFEAAQLGVLPLLGPNMDNFPAMTESLLAHAAALSVADEGALTEVLLRLLDDASEREQRRHAAKAWAQTQSGETLAAVMGALEPFLGGEPTPSLPPPSWSPALS